MGGPWHGDVASARGRRLLQKRLNDTCLHRDAPVNGRRARDGRRRIDNTGAQRHGLRPVSYVASLVETISTTNSSLAAPGGREHTRLHHVPERISPDSPIGWAVGVASRQGEAVFARALAFLTASGGHARAHTKGGFRHGGPRPRGGRAIAGRGGAWNARAIANARRRDRRCKRTQPALTSTPSSTSSSIGTRRRAARNHHATILRGRTLSAARATAALGTFETSARRRIPPSRAELARCCSNADGSHRKLSIRPGVVHGP